MVGRERKSSIGDSTTRFNEHAPYWEVEDMVTHLLTRQKTSFHCLTLSHVPSKQRKRVKHYQCVCMTCLQCFREKNNRKIVNYLYTSGPNDIYEKIGGESLEIPPVPGVSFCRFRGLFLYFIVHKFENIIHVPWKILNFSQSGLFYFVVMGAIFVSFTVQQIWKYHLYFLENSKIPRSQGLKKFNPGIK